MTQYEVVKDEGVDINGDHYDKGHEFEFDTVPDHFNALIEDGSVVEVGVAPKTEEAPAETKADDEEEKDEDEETI